jgi:hypothetical protein
MAVHLLKCESDSEDLAAGRFPAHRNPTLLDRVMVVLDVCARAHAAAALYEELARLSDQELAA